jgi:hypothetical protein
MIVGLFWLYISSLLTRLHVCTDSILSLEKKILAAQAKLASSSLSAGISLSMCVCICICIYVCMCVSV